MTAQTIDSLSDFTDTKHSIYVYCQAYPHYSGLDVRDIIERHGYMKLPRIRQRLRCTACGLRDIQISISFSAMLAEE